MSNPVDLSAVSREESLDLYRDLVRLRRFEDKVYQLFLKDAE